MKRVLVPSFLLLALGFLAGCASYSASHQRSLADTRRFFVLSNANDNRALDHQIATALRARGFEADTGPLTMMPDDAQVVVTYQDQWTWDFGDHLVYLQISVRSRRSPSQHLATATFSTRLPTRKPTDGIVAELVGKLLESGKP
ncbi:MAG TPA: hypothetical protein VIM71_07885 [Lacunisphaera sp.]